MCRVSNITHAACRDKKSIGTITLQLKGAIERLFERLETRKSPARPQSPDRTPVSRAARDLITPYPNLSSSTWGFGGLIRAPQVNEADGFCDGEFLNGPSRPRGSDLTTPNI